MTKTARATVCISLAGVIVGGHVVDIGSDGEQDHEFPNTSRILQAVTSGSSAVSADVITFEDNVLGQETRVLAPGIEPQYTILRSDPDHTGLIMMAIDNRIFELE